MLRREATAADLKKEKKSAGAKSTSKTRNGTFDGVKLSAKLEKRHSNADIVVAALLWSERLLDDSRTNFDRPRIQEVLDRLNNMVDESSDGLQSRAA